MFRKQTLTFMQGFKDSAEKSVRAEESTPASAPLGKR
jgi:hypothetical protein